MGIFAALLQRDMVHEIKWKTRRELAPQQKEGLGP